MMRPMFFTERETFERAVELLDRLGDEACGEAADQAERSRERGNIVHFCRWREIERLIVLLSLDEAIGTVH